jgi:regulatory protein
VADAAQAAGRTAALTPSAAALKAAAGWLSRRDYCSAELAQRLAERGFDADTVQAALATLAERHFVDDARYARAFVAMHAGRGQGPRRIHHELTAVGLASELAETALHEYAAEEGGWAALARRVRVRRFGATAPRVRAEWARQARFLHYRGFSTDHIRAALGDEALDGTD